MEGEAGNNVQDLYICNTIVEDMTTNTSKLTGIALPYWRREKSSDTDLKNVDAITGASTQSATEITSALSHK